MRQLEELRLWLRLHSRTNSDFRCMLRALPNAFPGLYSLAVDFGCDKPLGMRG